MFAKVFTCWIVVVVIAAVTAQAQSLPVRQTVAEIPQAPVPAGASYSRAALPLPAGTPDAIARADTAIPLDDLVTALERVYWTNPALLAERSRLRSSDFRLPLARAQYGPRVEYQAAFGGEQDRLAQVLGGYSTSVGPSQTASLVFTQPLFGFGRTAAAEDEAGAQIAFQRASVEFSEEDTLFKTISAYIAVLRDRGSTEIAADNLALLARELRDNRERLSAREVTITDVQQIETRVDQGRVQVLSAASQKGASEAEFLRVVGAPAGALTPPNPLAMPVHTLEEAYVIAERNSPVVTAAYAREKISRAQVAQARAELMPHVDLRASADAGRTAPYLGGVRHSELRAGIQISGTLFDSGLRDARIGEAEAANDSDWRLIDSAVRDAKADAATQWDDWLTQRAALDRLEAAIHSAQDAYDGALLQERAGLRTTLDVLDLARELLSARSAHNAASANAYIAQARLLKAIGMLNLEYLLPGSLRYERDEHLSKVRSNSDVPLLTAALRAADRLLSEPVEDRASRDPASRLGAAAAVLPSPEGNEAQDPLKGFPWHCQTKCTIR